MTLCVGPLTFFLHPACAGRLHAWPHQPHTLAERPYNSLLMEASQLSASKQVIPGPVVSSCSPWLAAARAPDARSKRCIAS